MEDRGQGRAAQEGRAAFALSVPRGMGLASGGDRHRLAAVPAPLTFLSDYGHDDDFVGVCHAVIGRIAPGSQVVDLTHGIDRHDVRTGAIVLRRALPYCAPGVHLAVVDPEVGAERRGVALRTAEEDRLLVGPDNGLLSLAAQRFGGVVEAVDVARSPYRLEPVSATFHGRDLFAPVAAHLAAGASLAEAGDPLDPLELEQLEMPLARIEDGELVAHAITFDRFGNITLDVEHPEVAGSGLQLGRPVLVNGEPAHYATTFADVPAGDLLLYEDAYRTLALAVNRGSAADRLGIARDDELRLRPA
jgi:S-adenosyl-L-methionine hydrolase (adenosine-forming)